MNPHNDRSMFLISFTLCQDISVVSKSAAKLLKAQGIIPLGEKERQEQKKSALTTVLVCVHCKTPNKPNAKFCSNVQCGMILNWQTHIEKVRESESHMKELAELKAQQKIEESKFKEINKKMELMSNAQVCPSWSRTLTRSSEDSNHVTLCCAEQGMK